MTCCVGIRWRDGVLLGHDSFLGDKEEYLTIPSKALPGPDDSMWLYAGDYANALRLGRHLAKAKAFNPYLALDWLQEHPDRNSDVEENRPDLDMLVRLGPNLLYLVDSDGAMAEVDWWAIGSGSHYARGALKATLPPTVAKTSKTVAHRCLVNALQIAGELCPTVCGPYSVL